MEKNRFIGNNSTRLQTKDLMSIPRDNERKAVFFQGSLKMVSD